MARYEGPLNIDLQLDGPNVVLVLHVPGHSSDIICAQHFPHEQAREFAQAITDLADTAALREGLETGGEPERAARVILPTIDLRTPVLTQNPKIQYGLPGRGKV